MSIRVSGPSPYARHSHPPRNISPPATDVGGIESKGIGPFSSGPAASAETLRLLLVLAALAAPLLVALGWAVRGWVELRGGW